MKNDELIESLNYYKIDDKDYINRCKQCLIFINSNDKVLKQFNAFHKILFVDKSNKIRDFWKLRRIEELFETEVNPFITNILLLSGYKYHEGNMIRNNFDEEQININKIRVRETLLNDVVERKYDGIRISQMLWGAYFINCIIIEIGRLQYEHFSDEIIKIHIPKGEKLNIDAVKESIEYSYEYIIKYFDITNFNYYCYSWLLSKQIHELVDRNSNIYKFYELFEVTEGEDCLEDVLKFVFGENCIIDYAKLSESTSLQREIKKYLMSCGKIRIGKGRLKV